MKIIVTGGRGYADKDYLYKVLDSFHNRYGLSHVIHGASGLADTNAGQWAREHGVQPVACPANWDHFRRSAGPIRNKAMAELGPDLVIAFPGNNGTRNMVQTATEHEIEVINALDYRR